jgi:AraC family transcriptional activator of pobA
MTKQQIPFKTPSQFFKDNISKDAESVIAEPPAEQQEADPPTSVFSLMRIEQFSQFIKFPITPFRSTVYEFCYIKKGQMVRSDAYNQYVVGPDYICFYGAGNIKSVESCSSDAEGYYCLFDKDYILQLLKNKTSLDELPFFKENGNPLLSLSAEDSAEVYGLLLQMEKEFKNQHMEKKAVIGLLLCLMLLKMKRLAVTTKDKKIHTAPEILAQGFMDSVRVYALTQKSAKFYAATLYVTPNHLNKCVKDCTGKPVSVHILEMTMLEAKILLKQKPNNITEIAAMLGFQNVSYFTRVFKKHSGYAPKDYREKFVYPSVT